MIMFYSLMCFLAVLFAAMTAYMAIAHAKSRFAFVLFWMWCAVNAIFAATFALMALMVWPT